jgi:hypothetical protein
LSVTARRGALACLRHLDSVFFGRCDRICRVRQARVVVLQKPHDVGEDFIRVTIHGRCLLLTKKALHGPHVLHVVKILHLAQEIFIH